MCVRTGRPRRRGRALPRARRRCEAGKRTHGPGPRACLALLAATALLALAAPAQAQTEIWSATLTPVDLGDGVIGCLAGVAACSSTAILSDDDFTHDSTDYTVVALYVETSGLFTFSVDTTITTETNALTLVVDSTSLVLADATTRGRIGRIWASSGVSLTVGTAINVKLTAAASTNTAPTVANTIPNQTATAGTAFSYAFLANTFADTDPGDTLTYTATQSDDTALPSWLSFAAATRTFSGTPTAADVGTVSVKVTASDGHGGSVSDTFDIVVSAAPNTLATGAPTITGTAQVGQTLTAGTTAIMDADGLTSVSYTYQWIGVATDNTETNISSATTSTYMLVAADQGTTVKVTVSFTDDANNPETLTSAATATVSAAANTQTEIWSATLTPVDLGDGVIGCLAGVAACSSTAILSDDDFTHDSTDYTVVALYVETSGLFTFSVDTTITTETNALTLVVDSTSLVLADATTRGRIGRIWASSGVSLTVGTAINVKLTAAASTNTAPTVANTIPNQTATAGTAFSYAFLANTFADTDPGDTLTYTATQSDDTALPSWLSFAAATRTFSGTPTAADVGTVSVKVTASDGHGGSVSDTFDIVVSAAAGVTVSKSALTVTEEDTTGDSYTVVLDSQPTANVTVTVAGHAGTDVTPSPTSLTFTTTTWGTAQTVTVKAGNDTDTTNDTVTLTHSAASTDSNYGGITIGSVVVTVADNDTANTAPTAADTTVTTGEDRAYAFTADDFGFADDDAGDTLASVTIVTTPAVGTLALDGTAVLADGVVTKAQIDDSDLTFTPARDAHGAPYTTFTFTVNDGTDDSASANTMTIDVTDAPVPSAGCPISQAPAGARSGPVR